MKKIFLSVILFISVRSNAQHIATVFESSKGTNTATYFEIISFYKQLASQHRNVSLLTFDTTDAGYPLHLALISSSLKPLSPKDFSQKTIILINNGIHPGEPDGIEASMMLARDIATKKITLSPDIILAVIPVYNIGGCLNRNSFSRVNQDGPVSYGFRGNAQNLDLNRDFIKADSKDAMAFYQIFHYLNPDIFIDTHVSDGADYQHTMTLITTQHNKMNGNAGKFLHDVFEPALYSSMQQKQWPMIPYVNFDEGNLKNGWTAFFDAPRYSSGYAALFGTFSFIAETHMLKPFPQRVKSTYALLQTSIEEAGKYHKQIKQVRQETIKAIAEDKTFTATWKLDSSKYETKRFLGYEQAFKQSEVTGMQRMYYDKARPFDTLVKFYNTFKPVVTITKPDAYMIPQGWHEVIKRLHLNGVRMQRLSKDSTVTVSYYRIDNYTSTAKPYEKHHRNEQVSLSEHQAEIKFLKGDYIVFTGQKTDRYVMEVLEPYGDDSFFKWNFFDAILQRKEGYSDYRWEEVAAAFLQQHPEVKAELEAKKKADESFAASSSAQLYFVYTKSPYYEPAHLRYPVYRWFK